MKTVKITIIAVIALSVASMMGCKKNGSASVSPGSSKLSFQMAAIHSTTMAGGIVTDTIAGLDWTAGTADVSRFSFEARRNGVSIEIESHNADTLNLFNFAPVPTYVTLDTGVYKEIEVTAFLDHSSTDSIPLKLTGTFNNGTKTVPIEFDLMNDANIKVEANNIDLTGSATFVALVDIALEKLTKGVSAADLSNATLTNGGIVISKTSNTALYHKILSNISGCGHGEWREHHGNHWDD